jgi:hypothetical protein
VTFAAPNMYMVSHKLLERTLKEMQNEVCCLWR